MNQAAPFLPRCALGYSADSVWVLCWGCRARFSSSGGAWGGTLSLWTGTGAAGSPSRTSERCVESSRSASTAVRASVVAISHAYAKCIRTQIPLSDSTHRKSAYAIAQIKSHLNEGLKKWCQMQTRFPCMNQAIGRICLHWSVSNAFDVLKEPCVLLSWVPTQCTELLLNINGMWK